MRDGEELPLYGSAPGTCGRGSYQDHIPMKQRLVLVAALGAISILPLAAAEAPSVDAALEAYQAKDFGKCADILEQVSEGPAGLPSGMDLFRVECLAAAGRTEVAFAFLDKQLPLGGIDLEELEHKDRPGLNHLRATPGWAPMLAKARQIDAARQARIDQPLRKELLARVEKDQAARQQAIEEGNTEQAWARTVPVDRDNTAWLKDVVAHKGWPTRSMVGLEASKAAFLIAQHATLDPAFQEQVLMLMQAALERKEADPADYALLKDRVLLHQGKPQIYGTQFGRDRNGTMFLDRTQDLEGLDARRASMGLPPIAEYKKTLSEIYHAKVR